MQGSKGIRWSWFSILISSYALIFHLPRPTKPPYNQKNALHNQKIKSKDDKRRLVLISFKGTCLTFYIFIYPLRSFFDSVNRVFELGKNGYYGALGLCIIFLDSRSISYSLIFPICLFPGLFPRWIDQYLVYIGARWS